MRDLRRQLTPELIDHYNRPGPRYTSYPTAVQMGEDFDVRLFEEALGASDARPLSLYFHLPFCKSLCYYCGCHMMVTNQPERIEEYVSYLGMEIEHVARRMQAGREVRFIHWGGGTPTFLTPDQITRLMQVVRQHFCVRNDAELSIEGDPRTMTREHVLAARTAGFNRISLGVQDLDEQVQQAIGRIQPEEMVQDSLRMCREAGFHSVSADLIYGLPHQSADTFRQTLDRLIALDPDRISLFSYAHVPWIKKHQRAIPVEALPAPREKLGLFLLAVDRLTRAGYRHIGMDHFARPDDPLCHAQDAGLLHRNFQGYATDAGCDLIGLGISSISQLDSMYVQNVKSLREYYVHLERGVLPILRGVVLSKEDQLRRFIIMRLMCDFVVDRGEVEERFDIDFDAHFCCAVEHLVDLEEYELVADDGLHIRVTDLGRLFIRNIAMLFDAYLPNTETVQTPAYSQTI